MRNSADSTDSCRLASGLRVCSPRRRGARSEFRTQHVQSAAGSAAAARVLQGPEGRPMCGMDGGAAKGGGAAGAVQEVPAWADGPHGVPGGAGGGAHRRLPLQQRGGRRNPPWPRGAACASHAHRGRLRPRHRHSHRRFRSRRRRRRRRRRLALFPNATDHVIPLLRRGALLACAGAAVPTPPPSPARRGVARTVMRCGNVVWGGSVASHGVAAGSQQKPKEILAPSAPTCEER